MHSIRLRRLLRVLPYLGTAACCVAAAGAGCASHEPDSGAGSEGVSAGEGGAYADAEFPADVDCQRCHPNHVAEWRMSPHAYAMRDPVFHAMVRLGQEQTEGKLDQFCTQCHTPIGVDDGESEVFVDESGVSTQKTQGLSAQAMAGVSCEVCHSVTSIDTIENFNAHFEMTRDGVRRATIRKPLESSAHDSEYSSTHGESKFCGACHDVVNEFFTKRLALERTMSEWKQSVFPGQKSCQDCHMESYQGSAAEGGPERTVHRHTFVGVDVSLLPAGEFPGYDEMRQLAESLLQESAELSAEWLPDESALFLTIQNLAGHALPSGATVDREMWVELIVKDAAGKTWFESGTLDDNGDLRVDDPTRTTDPGSDPQLVLYHQEMFFDPALEDPSSTEPRRQVDFLWEPNAEESHLIRAGGRDQPQYDLSALPAGDYVAHVRLMFRTFPPHLLRKLEDEADLDPAVKDRVPTVEMETLDVPLSVP
jgi:hypothetical protein